MEAVLGLLVMLVGVSQAVETDCDGAQCYGALGGTVNFRLVTDASKKDRLLLRKNKSIILDWKQSKIRHNKIQDRSSFTVSNGIFRIINLSRNDSAEYTVEIYDSTGIKTDVWTVQLTIQAPVSSPKLVSECLSQGEMKVSCSSERGDSPQYSWTLDGHMLTDAELLCGNSESKNITLRLGLSGRLLCTAKNHISEAANELQITPCEAPVSSPKLVSECLSQGMMKVSCSSERGDSPQYSWTLDGHMLTDAELLSGNSESNTITLRQGLSGRLLCTAKNHISEAANELQIAPCEAPVSSPKLVSECLSQGEMKVSCSSERGDSPQYSWTLDGHMLTDAELLSGNSESKNITLRQGLSGRLLCTAKNHISEAANELQIAPCEAPVSSPKLVSECLSQGEMKVSCSSERGDSPQYSWTLDGHMLTDAELLCGNIESNTITLRQGLSGRLLCTAKNHISEAANELQIAPCEGFILINCTLSNGTAVNGWVLQANNTLCVQPTTTTKTTPTTMGKEPSTIVSINPPPHITPTNQTGTSMISKDQWYMRYLPYMIASLCAIIVAVLALAVCCACKKKKETKEKDNQGDQDVTYEDVRITPRHGKPRPQQVEMQVEYGQVRFSQGSKRRIESPADDTLYAVVRKSQRS
ncbi:hemicentin-2-like isoform X2 [Genypterus blacodes]|uniref:hemicentin-2-like isoform X2 n=1 Tax=Genypterus blacodes TaxID=154954 RepID=UPI003F75A419